MAVSLGFGPRNCQPHRDRCVNERVGRSGTALPGGATSVVALRPAAIGCFAGQSLFCRVMAIALATLECQAARGIQRFVRNQLVPQPIAQARPEDLVDLAGGLVWLAAERGLLPGFEFRIADGLLAGLVQPGLRRKLKELAKALPFAVRVTREI